MQYFESVELLLDISNFTIKSNCKNLFRIIIIEKISIKCYDKVEKNI